VHGDALHGQVHLLGHDLGDGDFHALADVRLAEEGGDHAVGRHGQPGVELGRIHRLGGGLDGSGKGLARGGRDHHQGAHAPQEVAA
jgi:hypothetical protein